MPTTFLTSLPLAQSLLFYALVAAFWFPAWRWGRPRTTDPNEDGWTCAALAFVVSFGVFTLISGPLLLLHASTQTAIYVLLTSWVVCVLGVEIRLRQTAGNLPSALVRAESSLPIWSRPQTPKRLLLLLTLSLGVAMAYGAGIFPKSVSLALLALCFIANFLLAWRHRKETSRPSETQANSCDNRLLQLLFLGLLAVALVSPFFHFRADADDNLYLSEALLLQDSEAMAVHAPTHRGEELPANPLYGLQSFELWAAILARLSGLHPLIILRSLCGPLLLLLSLALYRGILRRFLPKPLMPAAMVFLIAYFLFGMSSQWTPNNYLLTRPQQGKTWLMHIGIAAMVLQSMRYLERPNWKGLALLLLTSCACLGWAPTAVLIIPAFLGTYALGHILLAPSLTSMRRVLPLSTAMLPQILFAAILFSQQDAILKEVAFATYEVIRWSDLFIFVFLAGQANGGGIELLALVVAPLLTLGLPKLRSQVFPLWFCVALYLVILNPLLFSIVRDYLAGVWGYLRFYWLLPLPLLVAGIGASAVHLIPPIGYAAAVRIAAVTLSLGIFPLCGANFVWSPQNYYSRPEHGIFLGPVENPYKISAGLLDVAEALRKLPLGPEQRILCHLNEVLQLAPLVKEFDFVFARDYQTLLPLIVLGREAEGRRRERLGIDFLNGTMTDLEAAPLLKLEKARYLVLGVVTAPMAPQLLRLGYQLRLESGDFSLWEMDSE
jgi:Family of unknown function (DUF6077)